MPKAFNILITFVLMTVAWTFFKAHTLGDALLAISKMVLPTGVLYMLEEKNGKHPLLENDSITIRFASYVVLSMIILSVGVFDGGQFIYFQF